jgi:sigma-B regulation protein RsbU (phosphoserine phosphatase)
MPDFEYREERVDLDPGGLLALFSDGFLEARRGREFFGDRRMAGALKRAARCRSLEEAGRNIIGQVDAFLAGQPRQDDISLLLVRREPVQGGENP